MYMNWLSVLSKAVNVVPGAYLQVVVGEAATGLQARRLVLPDAELRLPEEHVHLVDDLGVSAPDTEILTRVCHIHVLLSEYVKVF